MVGNKKAGPWLTLPLVFYREGSLANCASQALRLYEQEPPHQLESLNKILQG